MSLDLETRLEAERRLDVENVAQHEVVEAMLNGENMSI